MLNLNGEVAKLKGGALLDGMLTAATTDYCMYGSGCSQDNISSITKFGTE